MSNVAQLAEWIHHSGNIVAFTGAGISTESGIPDFRSPGGIWSKSTPVYFDDYVNSADARHEYWRQKCAAHRDFADALPNIAHQTLASWEQAGRLFGTITQNIDELHQQAGSQNVLELHGTARKALCLDCQALASIDPFVDQFLQTDVVPSCPECSGIIKHATISFGQALDANVLYSAFDWARNADLFIVIGSSLVVEPAASLPRRAKEHGAKLVIVNRDETPLDTLADLVLNDSIGSIFGEINARLDG